MELVSEQEGASSSPCLGDTGGAVRSHPQLGDRIPAGKSQQLSPGPQRGSNFRLEGFAHPGCPSSAPTAGLLLLLLGNPSCHLVGFPSWSVFPTPSQGVARLLPSPSVLPNPWRQRPMHTWMDGLPPECHASGASVPRTPPLGYIPGSLDSTSCHMNPWLSLTKPAPPVPYGSGEGSIIPTAIICLLHPLSPPVHQQAQGIPPLISPNCPFPSAPCHNLGQGPHPGSPGQQKWCCLLLSQT